MAHKNKAANGNGTTCSSSQLYKEGVTILHSILEEVPDHADPKEAEAYWINEFRKTGFCVNNAIPQPPETSQATKEGRAAYMAKWYEENKAQIRIDYLARRAQQTEQERLRIAAVKKAWQDKHLPELYVKRAARITCSVCKREMSVGHKYQHTSAKCANFLKILTERPSEIARAALLHSQGMPLREIVKDAFFVDRGYKPSNHSRIAQLLKEYIPPANIFSQPT